MNGRVWIIEAVNEDDDEQNPVGYVASAEEAERLARSDPDLTYTMLDPIVEGVEPVAEYVITEWFDHSHLTVEESVRLCWPWTTPPKIDTAWQRDLSEWRSWNPFTTSSVTVMGVAGQTYQIPTATTPNAYGGGTVSMGSLMSWAKPSKYSVLTTTGLDKEETRMRHRLAAAGKSRLKSLEQPPTPNTQ